MTGTYFPKEQEIEHRWHVVDATDVVLGRLATEVAEVLMGKRKPSFTSHQDTGDHVVVVNAAKVKLTGRKLDQKIYTRHSGYPGGLKQETARSLSQRAPERVVLEAIKGMLPKSKLGRAMLRKLRVYAGPDHRHAAQQPEPLKLAHTAPRSGE